MKPFYINLLMATLFFAIELNAFAVESNAVIETNVEVATPRALPHSRRSSRALDSTNAVQAVPGNLAATNSVQGTNTPAVANVPAEVYAIGTDLTSFDIISKRNIFNPNRSGRRVRTTRSERSAQIDSFTLVGTLSYTKGDFAIFDGSSSSYRKTVKVSESIAGYKIAEITPDSVKLGAVSNQFITLPIGNQMRRSDGGPWKLAGRAESSGSSYSTSSASTSSSSGSRGGSSGSSGDPSSPGASAPRASGRPPLPTSSEVQSEIMKKLMQKRESE